MAHGVHAQAGIACAWTRIFQTLRQFGGVALRVQEVFQFLLCLVITLHLESPWRMNVNG